MSCNTCLTLCRSYWSQHKAPSPREWQLLLELNSLTCEEPVPKLIQVNGCLCPCFGFQTATKPCNLSKARAWMIPFAHPCPITSVTDAPHTRRHCIHLFPFAQLHFITLVFLRWWEIPPCYCPNTVLSSSSYPTSKMCGLFANGSVLLPWDTLFRAEKVRFLQTMMMK